jgi:hypothetical protein
MATKTGTKIEETDDDAIKFADIFVISTYILVRRDVNITAPVP